MLIQKLLGKGTKNPKKKKDKDIVKKTKPRKQGSLKASKSVQDAIPYLGIDEATGIIKLNKNQYSIAYKMDSVNFSTARTEDQESIFLKYCEFLNSFDSDINFEITVSNKVVEDDYLEKYAFMKSANDGLDVYREEMNDLIKDRMAEGQNNLTKERYLVVTCTADNFEEAKTILSNAEPQIVATLRRVGGNSGKGAVRLSASERLEILYDTYNRGDEGNFGRIARIDGEKSNSFSFENMKRSGLTTKDIVAPDGLEFRNNYMIINGKEYAQALYVRALPTYLSYRFFSELTDLPIKQLTSLHSYSITPDQAAKMAKNNIRNINSTLIEQQKKAAKGNYNADLVNPELAEKHDEANKLLYDLTAENQKMFFTSFVIVHFAETEEELKANEELIKNVGRKVLVDIKPLTYQQEQGLAAAMPLGINPVRINRTFLTRSLATFMPFDSTELSHRQGVFYGQNVVSKNLIRVNKKELSNQNAFIFGVPGSGKSITAKYEIANVALSTDDDILIIDPEGEYGPLVELLGGETIPISIGSKYHINPLDMELNYADDDDGEQDPISLKSDFILSLIEMMLDNRLNSAAKGVIDNAVRRVYTKYLEYLSSFGEGKENFGKKIDPEKTPTLEDLQNELRSMVGTESGAIAQQIVAGINFFVTGSLNFFSHTTNVKTHSRIVNFDISAIGSNMKDLGIFVVLDAIWNRVIRNRKLGIRTWIYVDEIHLLFKNDNSAQFLASIYKRARKWGALPTGITQNVEDLLRSETARTIILNCEMVTMLSQKYQDRIQLADLLNISDTQLSYITNSSPGHGLIYAGGKIVPFTNIIPSDMKLYKVITTKPEDLKKTAEKE